MGGRWVREQIYNDIYLYCPFPFVEMSRRDKWKREKIEGEVTRQPEFNTPDQGIKYFQAMDK